ncbi:PDF receptor [Orchesella cincta]|uniref:PDF receptor n=1 Tax=Orchesella cincta TaxID=48709 RepID=A0A1D2M9S0_ORCCI|nr:PDF receptor [Orchesella cincta]
MDGTGNVETCLSQKWENGSQSESAFRICSNTGKWLDKVGIPSAKGWTNYTSCLTPEIQEIVRRLGSNEDAQTKMNIASNTRILEFVGLSFSLVALILSLCIFCYFRTLRNRRTRVHRHLFLALIIQVAIRLTLYTDQLITRRKEMNVNVSNWGNSLGQSHRGIENTPYLCEASYIGLEYARTAMFMWMFVEGLFLQNKIAGEFRISAQHPHSAGDEVETVKLTRLQTSIESGESSSNATTITWTDKSSKYDECSSGRISVPIRSLVLHNTFTYIYSRIYAGVLITASGMGGICQIVLSVG